MTIVKDGIHFFFFFLYEFHFFCMNFIFCLFDDDGDRIDAVNRAAWSITKAAKS